MRRVTSVHDCYSCILEIYSGNSTQRTALHLVFLSILGGFGGASPFRGGGAYGLHPAL